MMNYVINQVQNINGEPKTTTLAMFNYLQDATEYVYGRMQKFPSLRIAILMATFGPPEVIFDSDQDDDVMSLSDMPLFDEDEDHDPYDVRAV